MGFINTVFVVRITIVIHRFFLLLAAFGSTLELAGLNTFHPHLEEECCQSFPADTVCLPGAHFIS